MGVQATPSRARETPRVGHVPRKEKSLVEVLEMRVDAERYGPCGLVLVHSLIIHIHAITRDSGLIQSISAMSLSSSITATSHTDVSCSCEQVHTLPPWRGHLNIGQPNQYKKEMN